MNLPQSPNAHDWVREWQKTIAENPDIPADTETMIGWFANAIMAGHDNMAWSLADTFVDRLNACYKEDSSVIWALFQNRVICKKPMDNMKVGAYVTEQGTTFYMASLLGVINSLLQICSCNKRIIVKTRGGCMEGFEAISLIDYEEGFDDKKGHAPHVCSICKSNPAVAPDEDDTWWCLPCIGKWEKENTADWATGEPKDAIHIDRRDKDKAPDTGRDRRRD